MGDITLSKAKYVVADQELDLLEEMNAELTKNYGELNVVVSALDVKLRADHRITTPADSVILAASPPKLTVEYTDETGAWHRAEANIRETIRIGERSAYGKAIQKPGDVVWSASLVAGKWMMVFVVAMIYGLIVLWTWIQWKGMEGKFTDWMGITTDRFGPLGFVVAAIIFVLFAIFRYPSRFLIPSGGDGWMLKLLITALSAYAPIPGLLVQMIIWFTVVRNLGRPTTSPISAALDMLPGVGSKGTGTIGALATNLANIKK
jgi:hypothetical protein